MAQSRHSINVVVIVIGVLLFDKDLMIFPH